MTKMAISNIAWAENNDNHVYELMKQYSFTGIEIAPTRIFQELPYDNLISAKNYAEKLKKEYGFVIPSMQSIWYGRQENIFGTLDEKRILIEYTKKAIDFAEVIGCKNLVFGCPRNRNLPDGKNAEEAIPFFKEIGDYARAHKTTIGMEANPPIYNTNYINNTLDAFTLLESVNSEGFKLNLDIGTMIQNNESIEELIGKTKYINHVHISEPGLNIIERRAIHEQLKDVLQSEKYDGFISIEMKKMDNISDIEKTMQYVKEVFAD